MKQWSKLEHKFASVVIYGGQTVISASRRPYQSLKSLSSELEHEGYTRINSKRFVKKVGHTVVEVKV